MLISNVYEWVGSRPHEELAQLVERSGGAAIVTSSDVLRSNILRLQTALGASYRNYSIGYSYKTNYSGHLVTTAIEAGAMSEVVSSNEMEYAFLLGDSPENTIVNGPGKSTEHLQKCWTSPTILNLDSIREVELVGSLIDAGVEQRCLLGLRVAPNLGFGTGESRFGVEVTTATDVAELRSALDRARIDLDGVHFHHSGDRSSASFVRRLEALVDIWHSIRDEAPKFIDVGGGLASGMPDEVRSSLPYDVASLEEYGAQISEAASSMLSPDHTKLIVEPGFGLLADVAVRVVPVLDVKRRSGITQVILDSTLLTINPSRSKAAQAVTFVSPGARAGEVEEIVFGGNSCMEMDTVPFMSTSPVEPGDILVVAQQGAYKSSMASPFIQGLPAVWDLDASSGEVLPILPRTDASLLYQIHTNRNRQK